MNVYCLECDSDRFHFAYANPAGDADQKLFHPQGQPFRKTWKPARYSFVAPNDEDYNPKAVFGDFAGVGGGTSLGLTAHAIEIAGHLFAPYGELLSLNFNGDLNKVSWFHCTNVQDALDEDKSNVWRSLGKIATVHDYVFRPSVINGEQLFQLPYGKSMLFCTEPFKQKIEAQKLTGLEFTLLWSDEPSGIAHINERRLRNMNGPSAAVN